MKSPNFYPPLSLIFIIFWLLLFFSSPDFSHIPISINQSIFAQLVFSFKHKTRTNPNHSIPNSKHLLTLPFNYLASISLHHHFAYLPPSDQPPLFTIPNTPSLFSSGKASTSALMSVDLRQSLTCLRYPSRFETVSRTQLSKEHSGDLTRPIDHH